jgi:hypothetical protein
MSCYDSFACRHISNCSSLGNFTSCETDEHHLDLLDTHLFSEIIQRYCYMFTCCKIVECPEEPFIFTELTPYLRHTLSPTLILDTTTGLKLNRSVMVLLLCLLGGIFFILTLLWIKVNYNKKHQTITHIDHREVDEEQNETM